MRILVAVDESENAQRAVNYVGSLLRGRPDVEITLFHVLKPMPRGLLEHGGSEDPAVEAQLSRQLHRDQEAWIRQETATECPVLVKACEALIESGWESTQVKLQIGHEDDVAGNILEEARNGKHDTIVVGRHGTSNAKGVFGGGVTDHILRGAKGMTVWVVE
ncbi:MAG TPA: universal stress protein [Nitrospira sp.]|nr:universal stress protein [Nitrospira sp.]